MLTLRRVSRTWKSLIDGHKPTWARIQAQPRLKFGYNTGLTTLHLAAWNGQAELCQRIVDSFPAKSPGKGAVDPQNPADKEGVTPLHSAAQNGVGDNLEAARVILNCPGLL